MEHAFSRDMFLQCHAFRQLGHESRVVLLESPTAQKHEDIIRASMEQLADPEWWKHFELDAVVLGAWAMPEYTPIAKAIKDAGIKLIVRCDSGGKYSQYGRPFLQVVRDNFWSMQERFPNPVVRGVAVPVKTVKGYSPWSREGKVIEHMSYADLICIESPGARDLLVGMLNRKNRSKIASRVRYVAHPVKLPTLDISEKRKKQILCIGRWNSYPKNTPLLVKVLVKVLAGHADYQAVVVGGGNDVVNGALDKLKCPLSVRNRIQILGVVPHDQILELCNQSQINFVSSRWESFNIAAAESLCMGCSVVGPAHIASVRNFVSKHSGSSAKKYGKDDLVCALARDIESWNSGERSPLQIAKLWRNEVSSVNVGEAILRGLQS